MKDLGEVTAEEPSGPMWAEMLQMINENTKDETETKTLYLSCLKPFWIFLKGKNFTLNDLQSPHVVKAFMK